MGLLNHLKTSTSSRGASGTAEQDALSLLEEGIVFEQQGNVEAALQRFDAAIALAPNMGRAHFCRGNLLLDEGKAQAALDAYATALAHKPDSAAAHFNMGNAYVRLGRYHESVAAYRKAVALKPDFADALVALGVALESVGKPGEAAAQYRQALDLRPDYAEAHYNLGGALASLGKLNEAVESYRHAVDLRPEYVEAHFKMGDSLAGLGKFSDAAASYRQTLKIQPGHIDALHNLGATLTLSGQLDEAIACFKRVLDHEPDNAEVHMNLGYALVDHGQFDVGVASTRRALELKPDCLAAYNNLLFIHNYLGDQPASLMLAEARRFGELVASKARRYAAWPNSPEPGRCLRIGFMSGDLCNHPVGYFLVGVLEALASQAAGRLELFAYPNRPAKDETGRRIKACCRGWHSAVGLSDEALAQRIHSDGIDILIDLAGHTGHNRLPVFAWRPAPVQVSWLGYFATTGVAEMDYFIADPWTLPESEEANFTEKIWRLPETRLCFTPPDAALDVGPLPAMERGYLTFGCFNNLTKMNDSVVALWSRVLDAVPDSRLFLKAAQLNETIGRQRVVERFAACGIDPGRLTFEGYVPRANYLAAYQRVDIGLDPFPYTGGTTTVEALWMGVPVLTLSGERFLSRQGVGLLMNAGLPEWVAADPDDYVARAASHASNLEQLSALRSKLRQQVLASPIYDAKRFAQHFETALRNIWQEWCRKNGG